MPFVDVLPSAGSPPFAVALAVRFALVGAATVHVGLVRLGLTVFPVIFLVDRLIRTQGEGATRPVLPLVIPRRQ